MTTNRMGLEQEIRLSDERIEQFIRQPMDNSPTRSEQMEMARELLAYRAASEEPVGSFHINEQEVEATTDYLKRGEWPIDNGELLVYAAPLIRAVTVSDEIGEIRVGRLPTMNQDEYPGMGDWWVQLRIGEDSDEVLARVYGSTPQEANSRAEALACRAAMLKQNDK